MSYERRDLVGYGKSLPHAAWPGDARVAVNFVINYEEGGERTPLYGDAEREVYGEASYPIPLSERDYGNESIYEYGSRAGIWRLIRIFGEHGVCATVFAAAAALERHPEVAREMAALDYDFAGHGYRWEIHWGKDVETERADIARATKAIEATTGRRPEGWFSRYVSSPNTRELLQELGYVYDSTAYNDDLPYWEEVSGRPFLIIPYSLDVNDTRFWRNSLLTSGHFFEYAKDAFDVLYREGQTRPRMMSVGLHPRIIGRPGRAAGLERLLEYLAGFEDVWVTRRCDIAAHWVARFPAGAEDGRRAGLTR